MKHYIVNMKIYQCVLSSCLVILMASCDEIANKFGYVSSDVISKVSSESPAETEAKTKQKIKEDIAKYVKIIWNYDGSFCIQNDTDYTLDKVSVMTAWTQYDYNTHKYIGYQEPRQFTFIPAHSKSTSIEYDRINMRDMKGQIYEIKCSALGL